MRGSLASTRSRRNPTSALLRQRGIDELTRAVLAGDLKGHEIIKRLIRKWRRDVRPRA